jgi:hypothetical protein
MKRYVGNVVGYPAVIFLAVWLGAGCASRAGTPSSRTAAEEQQQADGGLPLPPPPMKKGIIVPSDVGIGTQPATTTPSAGSNNTSPGSSMGPASN